MPSAGGATKACLLGVGHPLLDISSEVDSKLVQRYGLSMDNTIMAEEKHVNLYVEMERLPTVKYIAGGSTLNTIRVAQWMLQVPEATSFVGCVGKDAAAEKLRACVARDHVEAHFCIDHKFPTGKCACLIVDKERSLVTDLQAARQYRKDHLLTKHMTPVCDAAKIIYVAGFMINGTFDTVMHLAEKCSKQDTRFCMNLSAPFLMTVKHFASLFQKVVPYIDILFGNEIEAIAFGQMMGYQTDSIEAIALAASKEKSLTGRPRVVVFTEGPKCTVIAFDGAVHCHDVPELDPQRIVDTNGAGDAFVGGFLANLLKGYDLPVCVDGGHFASQTIIQTSGTAIPTSAPQYVAQAATLKQQRNQRQKDTKTASSAFTACCTSRKATAAT